MKYKLYIFLLLFMLNGRTLSNASSNKTTTEEEISKAFTDSNGETFFTTVPFTSTNLITKDNSSLINNSISINSNISSININISSSFNTNGNEDFVHSETLQKVNKNETLVPTASSESLTLESTFLPSTIFSFNTDDNDVFEATTQFTNISDEIISNITSPNNAQANEGSSTDTTGSTDVNWTNIGNSFLGHNETLNDIISVRKCCEVGQFFSLLTSSCDSTESNIHFQISILALLESSDRNNISYQTGTLKACPETNEPPSIISDITNSTYAILNSGELVDKASYYSFDKTHYCLELVGAKVEDAALTLAYCQNSDYDFELYDYYSEHETEQPEFIDSYEHIVRKCCGEREFYSTTVHKCIATNSAHLFTHEVQQLSFESNDIDLKIISSRIHECPNKSVKPKIIPVDPTAYRLLHTGDIIEVQNGLHHNYSYYCLEMVGVEENEVSFTLALCSKSIEVPKCCPSGKYFDEIHLDCLHQPVSDNYTDIISTFKTDLEIYSTVPIGHFLRCLNTFPVQDEAENVFIKGGKLCNSISCFEKENFCIDYIGKDSKDLTASAFYCQKEYFVKCCKKGYILSAKGCTEFNGGKSVLLETLSNTRNFVNSFDTKVCLKNQGILLDKALASYVIWWVSNDGSHLTVSAEPNKKIVHNYCIDDFIDKDGNVGPGAYVCESDVSHMLPKEHHFLRYSEKGSLGKCCPENVKEGYVFHYSLESGNCEILPHNESLKDNALLYKASFKEEHFHDFPECPSKETGYHGFPFEPGEHDYADISSEGIIKITSTEGKCILREGTVKDRDYCIEYILTNDGDLKPAAFVCAHAKETNVYEEKFTLITICISISCICLLFTLIYLFTVQVKRGFVTVRKVNTLAGRILVSFVSSNLIGFATFTLTQFENSVNKKETVGCYILAGFVQFFNLAGFCWNTSICLESLLLTIDISISKCIRYLLHSLWAWGFPFATTLIMFVMDAYREDLPCGTITPKIGVSHCFHSDNDSILVYFYVPILFTLIANLAFIFGAKAMRKARLRKLEKGHKTSPSGGNRSDKKQEGSQSANSGMRTHQNLNTKTESIRIVLWTGTTWFSELAGFVIRRYLIKQTNDQWYNYLWYIPTCFNALRGVGIFGIIVLLPEKRKIKSFFIRTKIRLRKLYRAFKDSAGIKDSNSHSRSSTQKSSFADVRRRNMSVTTMISTLSSSIYNPTQFFTKSDGENSLRKASIGSYLSSKWESLRKTSSHNNNNDDNPTRKKLSLSSSGQNGNKPIRKFGIIRSVSQIDRRASNSSGNSFLEELEMEEDYGKRKCSIPLPKLQEEESYMEREESNVRSTETLNELTIPVNINNLIKKSHSDTSIYGFHKEKGNLKINCEKLDKACTSSSQSNMLTAHNNNLNKSLSENNLPKKASVDHKGKRLKTISFKFNDSDHSNEELNLNDKFNTLDTNSTTSNNESDLVVDSSGSISEEEEINIESMDNFINSKEVDDNNENCYKHKNNTSSEEKASQNVNNENCYEHQKNTSSEEKSENVYNENCYEHQNNTSSEEKTEENVNLGSEQLKHPRIIKEIIKHRNSNTNKISIEMEEHNKLVRSSSDGNYEVYQESIA